MKDPIALERLGLINGDFHTRPQLRNQWWFLDGKKIGFGDLRGKDILRIQERLNEGEKFEGFNENHGARTQSRENPTIVITKTDVIFPEPEPVSTETRRKNWESIQ